MSKGKKKLCMISVRHVEYMIKDSFTDFKYNITMYYLLIGCDIFMGLLLFLRFNSIPPQIPLFLSRAWGDNQLADSWMIIVLPFLMNLLFIVNRLISQKFFQDNDFAKRVFNYLNMFICFGFTFVFIKIIFLVT